MDTKKNIANLYLRHMHLVLQLITDDRFNQKPWKGLQEGHCHGHWCQHISTYFNMLQLLYVTFRCSVDHQISRHFYKKIVSSLFLPFLLRCRPFLPRCTSLMFTFQQSLPPIVPNNY